MDYTERELKELTIDRLFVVQKLQLKELRHYIENPLYDRNDIYFKLEEIDVINLVISKKMKNEKRKNSYNKIIIR